jgi:hypothetical protein
MKIDNQSRKASHHSPNDAIRIVPLHKPEAQALAPVAAPKLVYRNGPLITSVEIFTIFWGTSWQHEPLAGILAQMDQFFDFVLTSSLIDQLAEYNVAGQSIGHGKRSASSKPVRHACEGHQFLKVANLHRLRWATFR